MTGARNVVHFLLHVPKCAGTSVEHHFRTHLGDAFYIAPRWESLLRNFLGNRYPSLKPDRLDHVRVASGHSLSVGLKRLFPGATIRASVLLREPVSWHLSMYNFRLRTLGLAPRDLPFARWYSTTRRNPISRFLLNRFFEQGIPGIYRLSSAARLAFIEARLARFHFVGDIRHADEMIAVISREIGVPETPVRQNVTSAPAVESRDLDAATVERIICENRLDAILYDRWATRRWRNRAETHLPELPRLDQPAHLISDLTSSLQRELFRYRAPRRK